MNLRVVIYTRVSDKSQNVDQQAKYAKEYFERLGHSIVGIIKDKESGTTSLDLRVKFKKLLSDVGNGNFDSVGIYRLDRITRNWDDITFIERVFRENWDKCKLISASEAIDLSNGEGRFIFRISMAVACRMPEVMKERQRIGIDRAKEENKYTGRKKGSKNKRS